MQADGTHYMEFLSDDLSWSNYLEKQSRKGTFADNIILMAAVDYLKCNISVINVSDINPVHNITRYPDEPTLYIAHVPEIHYECVVPVTSGKLTACIMVVILRGNND